ncbi:MAG: hypothetical protein B6241_12200 [Spirochaetaceae bacterium 4572_59]|nr:MAG: hypothetical protein B6241_12200 [Spirochaetaceae bacterium 4572_59]
MKIPRLQAQDNNWYKLDNAGKIYPAILTSRTTSLFRISASLKDPIVLNLLEEANNRVIKRFPYYQVSLKQGFFWYYLETNPRLPRIEGDSLYPCMKMPIKKSRMFLFRVRAYKNRIAVEFSHILTDGTGASIYLKTLCAEYLRLKGIPVKADRSKGVFSLDEPVREEEKEDAFRKYFNPKLPPPSRGAKAFHLKWKLLPKHQYNLTSGILPIEEVKRRSKDLKLSLGEFLISVYLYSFQLYIQSLPVKRRRLKPIRMNVPVNLRKLYNSETMRNFFLSVEPWIDPRLGEYTLEEIAAKVHHYMHYEVDRKFLNQQITRNVKGELNILGRLMPLSMKNALLPVLYKLMGENNYTSGFSNLGPIELPGEMAAHIERFDFFPPPSEGNKIKCSAHSWKENLYISFGSLVNETEIERLFFTSLRKMGIPVKIESNRFY